MIPMRVQQWSIERLDNLAARFGPRSTLPDHLTIGLRGEREALFHLRRLGYTVVARRWSSAKVRGDLDLVAWHRDTLCFVEVKTRTERDSIAAEVAVDRSKRIQLRRLAQVYRNGFEEPARSGITTRFDVVSVYLLDTGAEFDVLENAFGWSEARTANPW